MQVQTVTKMARLFGTSLISISLASLSVPAVSLAQVCNFWGCSAPGAGPCTIHGCPAPAPQPTTTAPQSVPNIIIIPGNNTIPTNTTPSLPQRNPQQVAACIRDLHGFYYRQVSDSTAAQLANNACRSGASASCIQENFNYYYQRVSHSEAARRAQNDCTP